MSYIYSFEKLEVWKKSRKFVVYIYDLTNKFPKNEKYILVDQIRRASISISANLAEGSSRITFKDKAHFTNIAYSSLMEVLSHLYIAYDLKYVDDTDFSEVKEKILELSNKLNALRKSQINK